jgi:hypothetical protein
MSPRETAAPVCAAPQTKTYSPRREYGIKPEQLLYALGLKQIRRRGAQISACCPFHDDRTPSFSMNARTSQWFCHAGCGSGNATTLLARRLGIGTRQAHARLMEGTPFRPVHMRAPYVRKTTRCSGSKAEIETQLARASHFVRSTKMSRAEAAKALMKQFGISRATAYGRLRDVCGQSRVTVRDGTRRNVRSLFCLKRIFTRAVARIARKAKRVVFPDENFGRTEAPHASKEARKRVGRPRAPSFGAPAGRREPRVHTLFNPVFA